MTKLIGLPDGGAGIIFPDHPAHHNQDGTIQVTWSAETLANMVEIATRSVEVENLLIEDHPDDEIVEF
jgi:hypothetical protein